MGKKSCQIDCVRENSREGQAHIHSFRVAKKVFSEIRQSFLAGGEGLFLKQKFRKLKESRFAKNIEFKLEENVPLRASEVLFNYSVIENDNKSKDHFDVSVSVVPRLVAEVYADALEKSGLTPVSFEVESKAIIRSAVITASKGSVMVVNVRDHVTVITLVRDGAVWFTSAFAVGGNLINEALQRIFQFRLVGWKMKEEKCTLRQKRVSPYFFLWLMLFRRLETRSTSLHILAREKRSRRRTSRKDRKDNIVR